MKLKPNPRKLKPITMLPKIKDLQKEGGSFKLNTKSRTNLSHSLPQKKKQKADENGLDEKNSREVDFSNSGVQKRLCMALLASGNLRSYADFHALFVSTEGANLLGEERSSIGEKEMGEVKEGLENIEEALFAGQNLKALKRYLALAEHYISQERRRLAKFFFDKIINQANGFSLEDGKNEKQYTEIYVKAKLGYIKCLDFETEGEEAISMLQETYDNKAHMAKYKDIITSQLIELHTKMAGLEEKKGNFELALKNYQKSVNACRMEGNFDEQSQIALRIARLHASNKSFEKAITILKEDLKFVQRLKKIKKTHHEIECYRQIALCHEELHDFDEAEHNYKIYYEMLKNETDSRFNEYKSEVNDKLANLNWLKGDQKNSIKYYNEYFEETLKGKPKKREEINDARLCLGISRGMDEFDDFIQYLNISRNKIDDVIEFKKKGKISEY